MAPHSSTHSSVLAWRIPGTGSLVGCRLWDRTESDTTEATWQHGVNNLARWALCAPQIKSQATIYEVQLKWTKPKTHPSL